MSTCTNVLAKLRVCRCVRRFYLN